MSDAPTTGEAPVTPDAEAPEAPETAAPEAPEQEQGLDPRIMDRLDELSRQTQGLYDQFDQIRQPTEDLDDLDPDDPDYEDQQAQRWLNEQIEQGIQKGLEPHLRQQQLERRDDAFSKLGDRLPDFKNEQIARRWIGEAASLLDQVNPDAINTPVLVAIAEKLYKADKADERAAQETPADGRATQLEREAGAAPTVEEESLEDRLIKNLKPDSL